MPRTLRKRLPYLRDNKERLKVENRDRITHEDGSEEVPVSTVDLLLNSRMFLSRHGTEATLNKDENWKIISDEFEENCVCKLERQNRDGKIETVFWMPIIGHMLFQATAIDDDFILGAYRDIDYKEQFGAEGSNQKMSKKMKMTLRRNPAQVMSISVGFDSCTSN
jgi:hypothetical protein